MERPVGGCHSLPATCTSRDLVGGFERAPRGERVTWRIQGLAR